MNKRLTADTIWAEMARRKIQFHKDEKWNEIKLWGLFLWSDVKRLLDRGLLITSMHKENHTIWVWPSAEAWNKNIKPLIDNHTLDELTELAGW